MSHKLTQKQLDAIYHLARGKTVTYTAGQIGQRRETVSRWKQVPEFAEELERVAADMRFDMHDQLTRVVQESIQAIHIEIGSENCNEKRINSALFILKSLKIDEFLAKNASQIVTNAAQ